MFVNNTLVFVHPKIEGRTSPCPPDYTQVTNVKLNIMLSTISIAVVDVEDTVDQSSGINYYMLEKACVVLMAPQTSGRSLRARRNLIMNRGQIGPRTVGFDLATYSLLALGAKGT